MRHLGLTQAFVSLIRLSVGLTILGSCQSSPKQAHVQAPFVPAPKTQPPKDFAQPEAKQLTFDGENFEGYFAPNGQSIIYVSQTRPDHLQAQVYEISPSTGKEKRLTFHDGQDSCPAFAPDMNTFYYSSTTDEIKEGDDLFRMAVEQAVSKEKAEPQQNGTTAENLKKKRAGLPPSEIYVSRLNGSQITRLTSLPGYDSEVSAHPNGKQIIFSSLRNEDVDLFTYDLKSKAIRRLTTEKGHDGGAFYSNDGKSLVWRRYVPDYSSSQIWISKADGSRPKQLTTKVAQHWNPSWHPSGEWIIFSSNRDEVDKFELYLVDTKGLCLKRLTWDGTHNLHPSFSPDGSKVLFTSKRGDRSQLYLMDFKIPEKCSGELP